MGKGYHPRKERTRKQRRRVYIVCEGEKTEIIYFNGFKERNSGVEIITVHGKYTDPINIVKFAEERMHKWDIDFDKGDGVWCVFDVDENSGPVIKNASDHAIAKKIKIALSNPSFEVWYLLHFKDVFSQINRQDVILDLKDYIKDYKKNKDVNPIVFPLTHKAIPRAEKLNQIHEDSKIPILSTKSNPSTQVFELVKFINDLIKENKAD